MSEKNLDYGKALLRIALSIVFLYFGFKQIMSPLDWVGFVPEFATFLLSAKTIVIFNAILELCLGIFMILGLYTRFAALILSLHLLGIALSMINSPIGIRDLGLALATFSVFIFGPDKYCLDNKFKKK